MDQSFGGLPNKEISSVVSSWWRDRVKVLIHEERSEDARSLYQEFGEAGPKGLTS